MSLCNVELCQVVNVTTGGSCELELGSSLCSRVSSVKTIKRVKPASELKEKNLTAQAASIDTYSKRYPQSLPSKSSTN